MTTPKLTPWFVNGEKPARPGVYQTKLLSASGESLGEGWSVWKRGKWKNQMPTKQTANDADYQGAIQNKPWRGLAEKPE